jgi:uncharacterized membrane protein
MMQINVAAAGRGAGWLLDGFGYFTRGAGAWLIMTVIILIFLLLSMFIPVVNMLFIFLSPVLMGGMLLGCRELDRGDSINVNHLFAGFSSNTGQLILLGLFHFIGLIIIMIISAIATLLSVGVDAMNQIATQMMDKMHSGDVHMMMEMSRELLLPALLMLLYFALFYLPLLMALWFAPALVMLDEQTGVDAMVNSFKGCVKNIVPYLVYGLVGLVFCILASIPMFLGWLVLFPMIVASIYLAYRDIFKFTEVEAGT